MLTRFVVENYKCLGDVQFPLTPIHVLIGQNDAGKTSVLEAMYALYRSVSFPLPLAFAGHWEGLDLVSDRSTERTVILGGVWEDAPGGLTTEYELRVTFGGNGRQCQNSGESFKASGTPQTELSSYDQNYSLTYADGQGRRVQEQDRAIAEHLGNLMRGVQLYRFDPKEMALPCALNTNRRFRMDRDGFGLAGLIDDILGHDARLFLSLRERFCDFFPQFRSIRIETESAVRREFVETGLHSTGEAMGKGIYFETRSGRSIRAQQVSDGAILFLGYLALAHIPEPPRLLLIEEPETGIYPKRLEEVLRLLRQLVVSENGKRLPQIVMTTHSPYVLSQFTPEEVTFMSRDNTGAVVARPLRDAPHIHERLGREFYLGELWYNLTEEELFGDE